MGFSENNPAIYVSVSATASKIATQLEPRVFQISHATGCNIAQEGGVAATLLLCIQNIMVRISVRMPFLLPDVTRPVFSEMCCRAFW
jgi:hypothetical protein